MPNYRIIISQNVYKFHLFLSVLQQDLNNIQLGLGLTLNMFHNIRILKNIFLLCFDNL